MGEELAGLGDLYQWPGCAHAQATDSLHCDIGETGADDLLAQADQNIV
jgi:hypothetical protein